MAGGYGAGSGMILLLPLALAARLTLPLMSSTPPGGGPPGAYSPAPGLAWGFRLSAVGDNATHAQVKAAANRYLPGVTWRTDSAVRGDFTCSGTKAWAVLGADEADLVIAVFTKGLHHEPEALRYSRSSWNVSTATLSVGDMDYDPRSEVGSAPPGLKRSKTCKELNLSDGEVDSVHIYRRGGRLSTHLLEPGEAKIRRLEPVIPTLRSTQAKDNRRIVGASTLKHHSFRNQPKPHPRRSSAARLPRGKKGRQKRQKGTTIVRILLVTDQPFSS